MCRAGTLLSYFLLMLSCCNPCTPYPAKPIHFYPPFSCMVIFYTHVTLCCRGFKSNVYRCYAFFIYSKSCSCVPSCFHFSFIAMSCLGYSFKQTTGRSGLYGRYRRLTAAGSFTNQAFYQIQTSILPYSNRQSRTYGIGLQ